MTTPVYLLPEIAESQAAKYLTHNEALRQLESTKRVLGTANDDPGGSVDGDSYIVGSVPAGAFVAFATNDIAIYDGTAWRNVTPLNGWYTVDVSFTPRAILIFDGTNWGQLGANPIEAVTATTFEPTLTNTNGTVLIDNATHTLNIPDNATVPYPTGTTLRFVNQNAAAITVTDDVAVTYATGSQNLVTAGIAANAAALIQKTGTDEWFVLLNQANPV